MWQIAQHLEVIAGHDPKDSTSIDRKDLDFSSEMTDKITGMKFGVPKEYLSEGISPEVKDAFMETLKVLTQMGAIVEFFSVKTMEYMISAYYIIASAEASSNLERFDGVKYGYRAKEYDGLHDMYKRTRTEGFGERSKTSYHAWFLCFKLWLLRCLLSESPAHQSTY